MPKDYSHITLLVDMDDTIENLLPAWAEWLNKKHGTSVNADDITGWDIQKFFPTLTKDEVYAPLFIPWWNVITIRNKQLINADILVDDGVHNLVGGSYKKILMTASHNKDFDASGNGMVRVNNWQEAYDKIIEYANQILAGRTETAK